jgi:hypothetical protein
MPSLSSYKSLKPIKMLLIGDSGKGKTGALASLAKLGFNLRILDYDNGLGILAEVLKADPAAMARIEFQTLIDKKKGVGDKILTDGFPKAFTDTLSQLNNWKPKDGKELGAVSKWSRNDILVLDSLSMLSSAAMDYILATNNRAGMHPYQSDWGEAMDKIEGVLKILYSDAIQCHVIVLAHITYVGEKLDDKNKVIVEGRPFPNTLGQKLPPKIPQYFNTMLKCDSIGPRRIIRTVPNDELAVKSEVMGIAKELPLETGLADFFKAAGHLPQV